MALWDQIEIFVNESIKFSKQTYEKAKELGTLTKKEFELKSLQGQAQKAFAKLGAATFELLSEDNRESISASDPAIGDIIASIKDIDSKIKEKEAELDALRGEGGNE